MLQKENAKDAKENFMVWFMSAKNMETRMDRQIGALLSVMQMLYRKKEPSQEAKLLLKIYIRTFTYGHELQ